MAAVTFGTTDKCLLYEGRIRTFDPEPGEVVWLVDHPEGDGAYGPDLATLIERELFDKIGGFVGPEDGRVRITVERL